MVKPPAGGRVAEGLKAGVLKAGTPLGYLTQNTAKSVCQPSDSAKCSLLEFDDFGRSRAFFGKNLVTVDVLQANRASAHTLAM